MPWIAFLAMLGFAAAVANMFVARRWTSAERVHPVCRAAWAKIRWMRQGSSLRRLATIVAWCAIACGGKTPGAAHIREGSDLELTDCTLLQKVSGTSSDSDNDAAATHAKNQAMEKAAALGATHIKWIVPCCTYVEGNAYRCDNPD